MDWSAQSSPLAYPEIEYVPMVRVWGGQPRPSANEIAAVARARPGSLWLIGNEPDVRWQDNVPSEAYALAYHDAYAAIKGADPTALVSAGSISQPTPLRLRYLDAALASYRERYGVEMPVDAWNIHNYMLREERDSWGVDIPPGMADESGVLYEIGDSGRLDTFRDQIVTFRRWMAERGYRNLPLLVTEFGIPMPSDYGFPPSRVIAFWRGADVFFSTATDPDFGYPDDGNRLVQRWCWYSLADTTYPTGNLFDPQTRRVTPLGLAWADSVGSH